MHVINSRPIHLSSSHRNDGFCGPLVITIFSQTSPVWSYYSFLNNNVTGVIRVFPKCFTKFSEFSDKIFVITVKGLEPATSCVRDEDATTVWVFKRSPIHA